MRVIPPCVIQEELKLNKANIDTRGKSKEEVLEGYPELNKLIEASMYDNTTVH